MVMILVTGCKKTDTKPDNTNNTNTNTDPLGTMPASFVQRVMMEEVTAEWCSGCPNGADTITKYQQEFGEKIIAVSMHGGDWLDYQAPFNPVFNAFGQSNLGLPCAAINRIKDPAGTDFWYSYIDWPGRVPALLAQDHKTGIALKSYVQGDSAVLEVHIGFHTANSYDMRVNVFLVENNIASHSQEGASSGYVHQQVIRDLVTPALGDPISMSEVKEIVKTYKAPISGYVAANLVFAVSVEKWGATATDREVYNARQVKVGSIAKWE
ncbi:MAG: hypothetical protein JWO06_817 [Bacteroidota bacterium]|nr:hypothetical protein [Bacteroidota bacterium]